MTSQNVLVFDSGAFVDTSGGNDAESDNTQAAITWLGHNVARVTNANANTLENALVGKQVFVVPELENGNLYATLSNAARNVIKEFVADGGTLVLMADFYSNDIALLNGLFGFNLVNMSAGISTIAPGADNGPYDVGTFLPDNNGTYGFANIPAGSTELYESGSATTAALIPYGSGKVAFLAYDWYNARPNGWQDGGWNALLDAILENVGSLPNQAPTAVTDTAIAVEDAGPVLINVLTNDTDPDSGDTKAISSIDTTGTVGAVTINGSQISYDPGSNFQTLNVGKTAIDKFTYTMRDGAGNASTATVTVTITGVNDAPNAVADLATGEENETLTINVLANDTDVDAGHVLTLVSGSAPSGQGSVSVVGNKLVFNPDSDFDGLGAGEKQTATLSYIMRDEHGAQSTSTVTVTITGTNDTPTLVASTLTPTLGACDTGTKLGSDDLQATDPDSTTLTYTLNTLPAGTLLINGVIAQAGAAFSEDDINNGLVQLLAGPVMPAVPVNTPNGPISGSSILFADNFTFTVSDGDGGATPGTFTAAYSAFDTVQTAPQYGGYWGGNGNDHQLGTTNADNMSGGNGCDLMIGGVGNDQMHGQEGNNRLFGQDGSDNMSGGSGNDLLDGGAGNDQINANGGNNWLFGGTGNDNMSAGEGHDWMWGGDGTDTINANGGRNRIDAGADNDTVTAGNGNDTIVLGTGNDVVFANGGINKFQLGGIESAVSDGDDQYTGGSNADEYVLFLDDRGDDAAGWGNDVLNGFRIAEGDQLLAFNPVAGFWDDATSLNSLVASDFVTASRGTGGNAGDLTLTFSTGQPEQSSLTLKWFFWDNGSFGTTNGSSVVTDAQLVSILQATVRDGGSIASGSDFLTEAHNYVSRDFMLV